MLGAASAKDSDQLAIVPTRRECMKELTFTKVQVSQKTETVTIELTESPFL